MERSTFTFGCKPIACSINGTLNTTAAGHLGSTEITNTGGTVARQTYLPCGNIRSNTTNQLTTDRSHTRQTAQAPFCPGKPTSQADSKFLRPSTRWPLRYAHDSLVHLLERDVDAR